MREAAWSRPERGLAASLAALVALLAAFGATVGLGITAWAVGARDACSS